MTNRAWVTLATNDSYGLGALVLAHSLRRVASTYPAVVLITPSVTDAMRERLRAVFAEVITVDVLDSQDAAHLALLQRPELGITFTKIHCWNLTQYEKCVFLDADILVVQNCDELFEREELSAAPDVGWPDCFNSGVFVFKPSSDTFSRLITFAQERGSFDGGDQGLLNSFFSDWSSDNNKRLPFLYNVTSGAFYSYLPALKQFGQNLKIIHFIGPAKPWLQQYNFESQSVDGPEHLKGFLQLWWDLFTSQVHTQLDVTMTGVAGNLARVQPGVPLQHEAIDELSRRQGWESGNIDYMGADSFANIWAKISQTLSQGTSSPPKQPSLPKEMNQAPLEITKEAVHNLAEKVAATSLDESNDIPVPAREAAHAAGKTFDSSPEIDQNIEGNVPQSNLESISQLTEVFNTNPVSDVPAVISQLETTMAISKIESQSNASINVHDTKSPEPIASTAMHENEPKNETPKLNINSEQSIDVHVPEPIPENPIDSSAQREPIEIVAASVTTEAISEALLDTSKDETVSVQSDLHELTAEIESKPVSKPASDSKVKVESPSESHESKSSEVSVPTVSTPLPSKTETENITTEPELSIVQDAKVALVPEANKPQTVSASETPSDVPAIDPKPVIPIDTPESESKSMSKASEQDKTPEKADAPVSDSPPLANTPSQEEASIVPATKSLEEAAQETRL